MQPLFITVDPEKDTPEQLKEYIRLFHPRLIGLTGDARQIHKLASAYKIYYAKTEPTKAADRGIDHTAYMYLMDRNGRYSASFRPALPPTAWWMLFGRWWKERATSDLAMKLFRGLRDRITRRRQP